MPPMRDILGMIQNDEALNLLRAQEPNSGVAYLPAEYAQPSDDVGEELLAGRWGELADPMVLSARRWSPVNR